MPSFERLASAYVQAFLEQVMVSVACNGAHSLKQRLARWLLMMHDRSDEDTLHISQKLLTDMLGVQRPSITNVARGSDAFRALDPAVRSMAEQLGGEVIVVSKSKAYRIR